jgi:hypothetical protein
MVMSTEVKTARPAARQYAGSLPAWLAGADSGTPGAEAAKLGVRVSDTLSNDPAGFVERNRQPYGE